MGRASSRELDVAAVVNCTGPECDVRKLSDPLVAMLLRAGTIAPDPLGLGIRTHVDGRALARDGHAVDWLFTIGPIRKPTLWESTAIPEIREQAAALAGRLCDA